MTTTKDIEIQSKKTRIIFIFLIAISLAVRFSLSIYREISGDDFFSFVIIIKIIIQLFLITICSIFAWIAILKWKNKGPGLVINQMGIVDNSGIVSAGMVFWSDVIEINTSKIIFSDCIIVKVKKPERYIKNQKNLFNRIWLMLENSRLGSPVNISVSGLKYKYNELFRILQERYLSTQVESRTYELKREKDDIQREKKELVDSINYAKRIQAALLPSSSIIEQRLGESFILYLPKDIVSGDFYWVETVDNWVFFAICDCTGHGVPGALISIVCNNALNRAIREFKLIEPSKILDKVAELIDASISLDAAVKDGMDASVCAFNNVTRELFWAGANIPLWIAREGTFYELLEFKPDKQPIGLVEKRMPYTNHKIDIQKDDILYMMSDGFADQFGGENGKKLTRKKFKELLLLQRGKMLSDQHNILHNFHADYKGTSDQIDDILVMGIRIEK